MLLGVGVATCLCFVISSNLWIYWKWNQICVALRHGHTQQIEIVSFCCCCCCWGCCCSDWSGTRAEWWMSGVMFLQFFLHWWHCMTLYDTVWHTGWCLPCLDSSALWHQHSSDQTVSLLPTLSTHSYSTIIPELQKSIIWEGYHNLSVLQSSPCSAGQTFCDNKL